MGEVERLLVESLGEPKLKKVCEEISEVIRKNELNKKPVLCRYLFSYMADVISGWNRRQRSQE